MLRFLLLIGFILITIHASDDYTYYPEVQESYKFHKTPKKWLDARETCRNENAFLAMPKNKTEVDVLIKVFNQHPAKTLKHAYNKNQISLGFHDMFEEGEFVSRLGISIQYYFHKWYKNNPSNSNKNEHCVSLIRHGELNDYPCDTPYLFICQKKKKNGYSRNLNCILDDPDYEYFSQSNKYYKLHLNPKIWPVARAICQAEDGNLAIINNEAEEAFLLEMLNKTENKTNYFVNTSFALIGFHDIFQENFYITVKDEELQGTGYTKWLKGEPNNVGGKENCGSMQIYNGGLNDIRCDVPSIFICEIDA